MLAPNPSQHLESEINRLGNPLQRFSLMGSRSSRQTGGADRRDGGIGDGRGVAAALILGASAVQIGTGFLRCPEAKLPAPWADAIGRSRPEETLITRAFSGRPGRSMAPAYAR